MVHGIEVGHVFKLGTKYSVSMDAKFVDDKEHSHPIIMGCYGIGVTRVVASIVETCHDENGIIWPINVAPYTVQIIPLNVSDAEVMKFTNQIYGDLTAAGIDVSHGRPRSAAGLQVQGRGSDRDPTPHHNRR
jgi:prolyl-tRNA synthetase